MHVFLPASQDYTDTVYEVLAEVKTWKKHHAWEWQELIIICVFIQFCLWCTQRGIAGLAVDTIAGAIAGAVAGAYERSDLESAIKELEKEIHARFTVSQDWYCVWSACWSEDMEKASWEWQELIIICVFIYDNSFVCDVLKDGNSLFILHDCNYTLIHAVVHRVSFHNIIIVSCIWENNQWPLCSWRSCLIYY